MAEYRAAIHAQAQFVEARNNLALALKAVGDLDGAVAEYHQAVQLDPTAAALHYNLAGAPVTFTFLPAYCFAFS
jgi:Flp pilus assembly protein TadD